ncbi:MAG: YARHG domain-containing protein [Blautia sp.]
MFCDRCGAQIGSGDKFCQNCGAPVSAKNPQDFYGDPDRTVAYRDTGHGENYQDEDRTVAYRGDRYPYQDQTDSYGGQQGYERRGDSYGGGYRQQGNPPGGQPPRKNNKSWLYAVLGVVATLLVVFIVFEVVQIMTMDTEEEETVADAEETQGQEDGESGTEKVTPQATPTMLPTATPIPTPIPTATPIPIPQTQSPQVVSGGYLGNSYIFPDSASRELTEADFADKTEWELKVARNEIYARHGRIFDTPGLDSHFRSKSWYIPSIPGDQFNDNAILNQIELKNATKILDYELAHGMET